MFLTPGYPTYVELQRRLQQIARAEVVLIHRAVNVRQFLDVWPEFRDALNSFELVRSGQTFAVYRRPQRTIPGEIGLLYEGSYSFADDLDGDCKSSEASGALGGLCCCFTIAWSSDMRVLHGRSAGLSARYQHCVPLPTFGPRIAQSDPGRQARRRVYVASRTIIIALVSSATAIRLRGLG